MERRAWMLWFKPRIEQEGEMWSAYYDVLGLGDCGSTKEEAVENLKQMIRLYCSGLYKRGILEQRLQEKGVEYKIVHPKSKAESELEAVLV